MSCQRVAEQNTKCSYCKRLNRNTINAKIKKLVTHAKSKKLHELNDCAHDAPSLWRAKVKELRTQLQSQQHKIQFLEKQLKMITNNPNALLADDDETQKAYLFQLLGQVLGSDALKPKSFFFHYLTNTLENLMHSSSRLNRYSTEIIRFWLLVRYYGGKKTIETLRGLGNLGKGTSGAHPNIGFNLLVPSLTLLKKYTPQYKYGIITESEIKCIMEQLEKRDHEIILGIAYDETDIRNGLIYSKKYGVVIGAEEIMTPNEIVDNYREEQLGRKVSDQVIQFFLVDAEGTIAIPIACYGLSRASNHAQYTIDKLKIIIHALEQYQPKNVKIRWSSSDGLADNDLVSSRMKQFMCQSGGNWYHFFDYQHLVKNLRNAIFNEDLRQTDGTIVSVDGLMEGRKTYNNIPETCIAVGDRMKWEPVKALLKKQVINTYKKDTRPSVKNVGLYLEQARSYYKNWNDNTIGIESKISALDKALKYFSSFTSTSISTAVKHMKLSVESLKMLTNETKRFKTSCLSTMIVENFFSIVKTKNRYPSIFEYAQIQSSAYFVMQYKFSESNKRLASFPPSTVGKNYGDQHGIEFNLPDLIIRPDITDNSSVDKEIVNSQTFDTVMTMYKPEKAKISIRDKETAVEERCRIKCPYDYIGQCVSSSHKHYFVYLGVLEKHLCSPDHFVPPSVATKMVSELKSLWYDYHNNKIEATCFDELAKKVIPDISVIDAYKKLIYTMSHDSSQVLQDDQQNEEPNNQHSPDRSVDSSQNSPKPTSSDSNSQKSSKKKCGCGSNKFQANGCPTKSCPSCCQNDKCKVKSHRISKLSKDNWDNAEVFGLDFETTGKNSSKCGVTDVACVHLTSNSLASCEWYTVPGGKYVKPRVPVEPDCERKIGITNKDVSEGVSEHEVIKGLSNFIDKYSGCHRLVIIFGHNVSFDRDVLFSTMKFHDERFADIRMRFVNTVPIIRQEYNVEVKAVGTASLPIIYEEVMGVPLSNAHRAKPDITGLFDLIAKRKSDVVALMREHARSSVDEHFFGE